MENSQAEGSVSGKKGPETVLIKELKIDRNPYGKSHRLHDVLRLISVLAVSENSFKNDDSMKYEIRDEARSSSSWLSVAYNHPEFFRLGWKQDKFILLQRYLKQPTAPDDKRDKLTEEQTNKLIEHAYTLYDKAIARRQRNSFLWPFYGAIIAAITTLVVTFYGNSKTSKVDNLSHKIDSISLVIKMRK